MKKVILLSLSILFLASISYSQNASIEELLKTYVKEIADLNETKDVSRVLLLFDKSYTTKKTNVAMSGQTSEWEYDLDHFKGNLSKLISVEGMDFRIKILETYDLKKNDKHSAISARIGVEVVVDGVSYEESSYIVTFEAILKGDNNWVFSHGDVTQKLDKRNKGVCTCHFYEREGDFVAMINYPAIYEYKKEYDLFNFRLNDDKERIIKSGYEEFVWKKSGEIMSITSRDNVIGKADGKKEAIHLILNSHFKKQCTEILLR